MLTALAKSGETTVATEVFSTMLSTIGRPTSQRLKQTILTQVKMVNANMMLTKLPKSRLLPLTEVAETDLIA